MELKVFGRPTCQVCKQAIEKINYFLEKWEYNKSISLTYFDMDTVDGLAEGAYYEVFEIPTTVLLSTGDREMERWIKRPPLSKELKPFLDKIIKGKSEPDDED